MRHRSKDLNTMACINFLIKPTENISNKQGGTRRPKNQLRELSHLLLSTLLNCRYSLRSEQSWWRKERKWTCKGVRRRQDLSKFSTNITFRWNPIETTTFATILCHKFRRAVPSGVSCRVHGYKWALGGKVDADEGREK